MRQLTHIGPRAPLAEGPPPPIPTLVVSTDGTAEMGQAQPCAPGALVRIYTMQREWEFEYWLCPAGAKEMEADRWTVRKHRAPPFADLRCYVHGDACPAPT